MSGMIFETAMGKFAFKECYERHDLCLFCIIWNSENSLSPRYVDVKGININIAAFKINEYARCRLNQNFVSSVSLNSVSKVESSLIWINCSFAAHGIWSYFNEV